MIKTLSRDTSPQAEAVLLDILRRMPPWRKLQLVEESCRATMTVTAAGIRARHPDASEDVVQYCLRVAMLGESLADAVYGRPEGTA